MDVKNSKFKHFYLFKDIFSKMMYGFPVADTKAKTFRSHFGRYFGKNIPFKVIRSDFGFEFVNNDDYLAKKGIKLLTKRGLNHNAIAENAIKVVKTLIVRYLMEKKKPLSDWHKVFKKVLDSYNNTYNSQIKMKPSQVTSLDDIKIRKLLYPKRKLTAFPLYLRKLYRDQKTAMTPNLKDRETFNEHPESFKIGDPVYADFSAYKTGTFTKFRKSYFRLRKTIFRIFSKNTMEKPSLYKLCTLNGKILRGNFYGHSLYRAPDPQKSGVLKIHKIIKSKRRENGMWHYVRYLNYDRYVPLR